MFTFVPKNLKQLVLHLKNTIQITTGEPLRLDIERYLDTVRAYEKNPTADNIPSPSAIYKLSSYIDKIIENKLLKSYLQCAQKPHQYSKSTLRNIGGYYLNDYKNNHLASFLYQNILNYRIYNDVIINERKAIFSHNPVALLVGLIIENKIDILKIPEWLGIDSNKRIVLEVQRTIYEDRLEDYLSNLSANQIIGIIENKKYYLIHHKVWDFALISFKDEALAMKKKDEDHKIFSMARLTLKPPYKSDGSLNHNWMTISKQAREVYLDWAIRFRMAEFFGEDTVRNRFWKQVRGVKRVQEVRKKGEVYASFIDIGAYTFLEFKVMGAVYIYQNGVVKKLSHITRDSQIKKRNKVINYGGYSRTREENEGWIRHMGASYTWQKKVLNMIKLAKGNDTN